MAPAERSESGTFFTPSQLVSAVVRATLAAWLSRRLRMREEDAAALLDAPDSPHPRRAVARITVLDPAVGSGAFLLGALEQLARGDGWSARRGAASGAPAESLRRGSQSRGGATDRAAALARRHRARPHRESRVRATAAQPRQRGAPGGQSARAGHPGVERHRAAGSRRGAGPASRPALATATGRDKARILRSLRRLETSVAATMLKRAEESTRSRLDELMDQGRADDPLRRSPRARAAGARRARRAARPPAVPLERSAADSSATAPCPGSTTRASSAMCSPAADSTSSWATRRGSAPRSCRRRCVAICVRAIAGGRAPVAAAATAISPICRWRSWSAHRSWWRPTAPSGSCCPPSSPPRRTPPPRVRWSPSA